jgi:hypothetical protein
MSNNLPNTKRLDYTGLLENAFKLFFGSISAVLASSIGSAILTVLLMGFAAFLQITKEGSAFWDGFKFADIFSSVGIIIALGLAVGSGALFVSAFHVVILGLPASILGERLKLIRWWSSVVVGFFIGCIPIAGLQLSSGTQYSMANGVEYFVDGARTSAGWLQFAEFVLLFGFLGALGGFAFWLTWRLLSLGLASIRQKHLTTG